MPVGMLDRTTKNGVTAAKDCRDTRANGIQELFLVVLVPDEPAIVMLGRKNEDAAGGVGWRCLPSCGWRRAANRAGESRTSAGRLDWQVHLVLVRVSCNRVYPAI